MYVVSCYVCDILNAGLYSAIRVSEGLLVITVVILILVCVNIVQTLASQMLLWM